MKKVFTLIFVALFTLSILASCATTAAESPPSSPDVGSEATESANVSGDSPPPCGWTAPEDHAFDAETTASSYSVALAKNETESATLVVKPEKNADNLSLKTSVTVAGGDGDLTVEVFNELTVNYTLHTGEKESDIDILVPFADAPVSLVEGENCYLLVRVGTTKDTPAGDYSVTVELDGADGSVAAAALDVTVWDLTLQDAPACSTAVGAYETDVKAHDEGAEYKDYYDMLLDYGLSSYYLPYDVLDDKVDEYLDDPRVTSFVINNWQDDEYVKKAYKKLSRKQEWLDKAFFYIADEPSSQATMDGIYQNSDHLRELWPDCHIVVPINTTREFYDQDGNISDTATAMIDKTDIWCMQSDNYDDVTYDAFFNERRADGDKVWWYVCCGPSSPHCNLMLSFSSTQNRLLFWQQERLGLDGFLYWSTTSWPDNGAWTTLEADWTTDPTDFHGDGMLFYPGVNIGKPGPVASLRLEHVRQGLEDIKLLKLAEEKLGTDYMKEMVAKLSPKQTKTTENYSDIAAVRAEIAADLLAAK